MFFRNVVENNFADLVGGVNNADCSIVVDVAEDHPLEE